MQAVAEIATQARCTSMQDLLGDIAPRIAQRAAHADAEDRFVAENYADLKASGLIAAAVPAELGGLGASHPELCEMLRRIGAACGSTGLAFSMHTHAVASSAWLWRHRNAPLEGLLRRVAGERIVLMTSGGSDWLAGSGTARRVDGGYRVSGRKVFASGAPIADLFMTMAIAEDSPGKREVIHFGLPMSAEGVHVGSNWRTLGMRATASHDVVLKDVFVPDAAVSVRRTPGVWHPAYQVVSMIAMPLIYAVYLGIAQAARDRALELARRRRQGPRLLDLAGELLNEVRAAELAHGDMIAAAASDDPGFPTTNRVYTARALAGRAVLRAADLAFEVAGGAGLFRDAGFERLFRDLQSSRFHPLQDGDQRHLAAALAFGLDPDAGQ
jgi:alkylation response protein AidB-like acyl-CoA dehydrogenase